LARCSRVLEGPPGTALPPNKGPHLPRPLPPPGEKQQETQESSPPCPCGCWLPCGEAPYKVRFCLLAASPWQLKDARKRFPKEPGRPPGETVKTTHFKQQLFRKAQLGVVESGDRGRGPPLTQKNRRSLGSRVFPKVPRTSASQGPGPLRGLGGLR
jgi:hypothetical protein